MTSNQSIAFTNRAGQTVRGRIVEDYGHALLIAVREANSKKLVGRTMLFPKNDMPFVAYGFDAEAAQQGSTIGTR